MPISVAGSVTSGVGGRLVMWRPSVKACVRCVRSGPDASVAGMLAVVWCLFGQPGIRRQAIGDGWADDEGRD